MKSSSRFMPSLCGRNEEPEPTVGSGPSSSVPEAAPGAPPAAGTAPPPATISGPRPAKVHPSRLSSPSDSGTGILESRKGLRAVGGRCLLDCPGGAVCNTPGLRQVPAGSSDFRRFSGSDPAEYRALPGGQRFLLYRLLWAQAGKDRGRAGLSGTGCQRVQCICREVLSLEDSSRRLLAAKPIRKQRTDSYPCGSLISI